MDLKLRENLEGTTGSYILPFFWQHGEPQDVLREEIAAIQRSGISEFCVESRIYQRFCEEPWWRDFGFMLEEAKRRGMRVWLLDDRSFPTGCANNLIKEKYPHLRKWHIRESHVDVPGPLEWAPAGEPHLAAVQIRDHRRHQEGRQSAGGRGGEQSRAP
jgi:hypothetical protein